MRRASSSLRAEIAAAEQAALDTEIKQQSAGSLQTAVQRRDGRYGVRVSCQCTSGRLGGLEGKHDLAAAARPPRPAKIDRLLDRRRASPRRT